MAMRKNRLAGWQATLLLAVVIWPAAAHAGRLYLVPQTQVVRAGDSVGVEVWIDFSHTPVVWGTFHIAWDANALDLSDLEVFEVGDPAFIQVPEASPGLLEDWTIGDFAGLGGGPPEQLGTIWFDVLHTMPATTSIQPLAHDSPLLSFNDGVAPADVAYDAATLVRAPLPGAVWLLGSALALLVSQRRNADR